MSTINIHSIIDVQTVLPVAAHSRRDFKTPLFIWKGEEVSGSRVNYYTAYNDVVDAYGSTSEAAKAALSYYSGGFNGIKPLTFAVANFSSGDVLATVLSELTKDPSYYYIAPENGFSQADQETILSTVEASTAVSYMAAVLSTDTNIEDQNLTADTTSIAKTMYNAKYIQSFGCFDDVANVDEYKNVAALSYFCTVNFNAARPLGGLAFKQITGQTATELTSTQYTNILAKNFNLYTAFGEVGRDIFYKGVVPKGTFIDTVIGKDWLNYNITYNIFDLMTSIPKLSYTTSDLNKLAVAIASAFEQAKAFGLVAAGTDTSTGIDYPNGYEITIPDPADISAADKAAGVLEDIIVIAVVAGNIVKFTVTNYLKY